MRRALLIVLLWVTPFVLAACQEPYRVGEYVWVEWDKKQKGDQGQPVLYPAYITAKKGRARYRVHFEGYERRWDSDVSLDRIKGRIDMDTPVTPPPPPPRVARLLGLTPKASSSAAKPVSPFKVGDRVRVRWRESIYKATVIEVLGPDRCKVHYDGHEAAWDEIVTHDRILGRR